MTENGGLRSQHGETCKSCGQFIQTPVNSMGGRIVFLRTGKGLTIRGLAKQIINPNTGKPLSPTTVMRMEKNEEPRLDRLKLIAEYFGVSIDYLVYGEKGDGKKG